MNQQTKNEETTNKAVSFQGLNKERTGLAKFMSDFTDSPIAVIGLVLCIIIVLSAVFAPLITPQNPYDLAKLDLMDSRLEPGEIGMSGITHWLGTDAQGRDLFSAIIYGLRISLGVGVIAGVVALLLGTTVGLTAAYFGGRVDTIIMRIVEFQLSFPAILIALIMLAVLGQGIDKIIIALVAVQWAYFSRTVRSAALVERRREYIDAARCIGLSSRRIMFGHLMPNCLAPLIVVATVQIANAISLEATLSFLGLGMPVTQPSLGLLIANGFKYILSGRYWISTYPGIALLITVISINLVGDRIRDVLNPRLEK
ncbi:MAG: ABC transporter permease [Paracoccaceae bacterium]|nr:ABC transporter permease [Paracoccaceae bacterium]